MKRRAALPATTPRRIFTKSVAAALMGAPFVSPSVADSIGEKQSTRAPKQRTPTERRKPTEKPRVRMEHIPPTLITSGSFNLQTVEPVGDATNINHQKRKKKHEFSSGDIVGVRVVNIDGVILFNGYSKTPVPGMDPVDAKGSKVELWFTGEMTDQPEILISKGSAHLEIESDEELKKQNKHARIHPYKRKHPDDDVLIKHVRITAPGGKVLYAKSIEEEIQFFHILIWT